MAPTDRNVLIAEHISTPDGPYYVYLLVDPATKVPFYVGKGTGERFRSHGIEAALLAAADVSPEERKEKLERIRAIRATGHEPEVVFARTQIPSAEAAYAVEAALIDALARYAGSLVNQVRGRDSASGLISLEELERQVAAPEFTTREPAILIKLFGWVPEVDGKVPRAGYAWAAGQTLTLAVGRIGRRTDPLRSAAPSDIQQLATTRNARGRRDLSPRELEVLALVAYGRSDGEIAAQLFITKKTASVHVAHIKDKLGVENRVEIAMAGVRLGLVRPTTEAR